MTRDQTALFQNLEQILRILVKHYFETHALSISFTTLCCIYKFVVPPSGKIYRLPRASVNRFTLF